MIAKTFDYILPETREEAVQAFADVRAKGKIPLYYSGGSEIITMAQAGSIAPDAVIDVKRISEMNGMHTSGGKLRIGANTTLSAIFESRAFPLLGTTAGRIADHTNQVRITLGGNLCGTVIYREMALPLLLADAQLLFFGPAGERRAPMSEAFDGRVKREQDEMLCGVVVEPQYIRAPYVHVKKTGGEKIGYPLVTVTAMKIGGRMRIAVSGLCDFPLRSAPMERIMNDQSLPPRLRAAQMADSAPAGILENLAATAAFRRKVFIDVVEDAIASLGEV